MRLGNSRIYIYGIGGNGIKLGRQLNENGILATYIDKRANEIKVVDNLTVVDIDSISFDCAHEAICIVTIKNVFEHTNIAMKLFECGFKHIIYKSINVINRCASPDEFVIDSIYEQLVEKKKICLNIDVPQLAGVPYNLNNRLYISKDNKNVVTWCPIELIYNYYDSNDYSGLGMPFFFPLVGLYEVLLGKKNNVEEVLEDFYTYCGEWVRRNKQLLTDSLKESLLKSRVDVFQEMEKHFEADVHFWENNAPMVEVINDKFFLLSSGRNRISFLIAKGYKAVPIKMTTNEYEEWCRSVDLNKYRTKNVFTISTNPIAIDAKVVFADYKQLFLQPIVYEIIRQVYRNNTQMDGGIKYIDYKMANVEISNYAVYINANDDNEAFDYFRRQNIRITQNVKEAKTVIWNEYSNYVLDDINLLVDEIYCITSEKNKSINGYIRENMLFVTIVEGHILYGYKYKKTQK